MTSIAFLEQNNNLISQSQGSQRETQEAIDERNERLLFCPISLDYAVNDPIGHNGRFCESEAINGYIDHQINCR